MRRNLAEKRKARRNDAGAPLAHRDGARHQQAVQISSFLTLVFRRMYQPRAAMFSAEEVIKVLNAAGVKFVLMGAHGIGGWLPEPRASQDVDVLVQKRHHRKAIRAIQGAYPDLGIEDTPVVTRFNDPATGRVVIDLMKPVMLLHQRVFKSVTSAGPTHVVPDLEMALATKFAAMTSPNREERKKLLDGADFMGMVQHNREALNRAKLRRLAEKVYTGGGNEILRLVEDILAGRRIEF